LRHERIMNGQVIGRSRRRRSRRLLAAWAIAALPLSGGAEEQPRVSAPASGAPAVAQTAPAPLRLTGTVLTSTSSSGLPAAIALRPMASNHAWARTALSADPAAPATTSVTAGPDGRFQLAVPAAGVWEVEVAAAGHLPLRLRPLPVAEPVELPPVRLPRAETARVEVRTAEGGPAAGAWVLAESASEDLWREAVAHGWRPAPRLGRTDGQGRLTLPRAPGEELRVSVSLPGAEAGSAPVAGRGGAEIRVVLPAGRSRRPLGVCSDDGRPVAGVVLLAGEPAWPVGETGPDGLLALDVDAGKPLELLLFAADGRRGSATLTPPALEPAGTPVDPRASVAPVWLVLPRRAPLPGRVTDPAGKSVPGAVVWPRHDPGTAVRSDAEGRFELTAAPFPRYALQAEAAGFLRGTLQVAAGERPAGVAVPPVRLVLGRRRPVIGQVVGPDGRPIPEAEVAALAEGGAAPRSGAPGPRTASTAADGRFAVLHAPAQRFAVEVTKPGYARLRWPEITAPPGEGPIDLGVLRLVPGAVVSGRVSDRAGAPIADAEVWLRGRRPAGARRAPAARTDPAGAFRLVDLRPGEPIDLQVTAEGYLEAAVRGVVPPPARPLAVQLTPAARVAGRVVDGSGRPVAGAEVRLAPRLPEPGTAGVPPPAGARELAVTSGEDGGFAFAGVAPGAVLLEAAAAGFQLSEPLPAEVPQGGSLRDLVLVVERGATVEGTVSDRGGEPVPGALVQLGRVGARSDAAGRFRVEGVKPGAQLAEVDHRDFNRLTRRLEVAPEGTTADFVLTGGWPVAGRAVDEQGLPVAGAQLDLQQLDRLESRAYRAGSGEDGRFRFGRVAEGRYTLSATREGYAAEERFDALAVAGAAVEDVEVVLHAGAVLRGRILGLEPADLPRVRLRAARLEGGTRQGRVDPAGGYEIADLAPGEWQVTGTLAGGQRQAETRLSVPRGVRRVERDLRFGGGIALSGLALFDGRELAGARVALRGLGSALERTVATDYQGAFRIEGLDAGRYRLTVSHPGELLVHNEDLDLAADREVVVELRTAEVRGQVTGTGERPLAGAYVTLHQHLAGAAEAASLFSVVTGADGGFRQARLAPGRYRVTVRRDGYAPAEQWLELAAGAAEEVEIALAATEGLDLAVRLASGQVPLVVTVSAFGPGGALVLSEARGLTPEGFTHIATLPPGQWELWIAAPGAAVERRAVTVPGAAVEVVLAPAARLKVRIPALAGSDQVATVTLLDAAGRPFQAPEPGAVPRAAWPLAAGVGYVEGLPAGVWTVAAAGPRGEAWRGSVALAPGALSELVLE
jgi:Carboxypeptidase regulatory-like domain